MCHYVIEASSSYICMLKPDDLASIVSEIKVTVSEAIPTNNEENEQQIEMDYDGVNDHMEYDDGYSEYGDYPDDLPPEYESEYVPEEGYPDDLPPESVAESEGVVDGESVVSSDSTDNSAIDNPVIDHSSTDNPSTDNSAIDHSSSEHTSTDNPSTDNPIINHSPSPSHSHLPPNRGKPPRPHDFSRQSRRNKPYHPRHSHENC